MRFWIHAARVLFALCLLCIGLCVHAEGAPAWMHALTNVSLPAHDEKTAAVLLYAETVLTVQGVGKVKRLERRAYKILRPNGASFGVLRVDYDFQSRITALHGWCIPVQGKDYVVKEKDAVETSLAGVDGSELVNDVRSKFLRVPAAEPGAIVGYEYEQDMRPYVMGDEWDFQEIVPVREARYTLQLPPGWSYKTRWLNYPEQGLSATAEGRWQWTVGELKAIRIEGAMPPWRGIAGRMAVALIPPNGPLQGFDNWRDVGSWYFSLAAGRREVNATIKETVSALTATRSTTLEKIRALANFVQSDIRYVAIELGVGGQQPHAAAEVFAARYGDCKDKVTLLSSMLKEIGIDSFYVLINTERGSIDAATPPTLDFNHVILAIQLPTAMHDPALRAMISHRVLGAVLFFDPTDDLTPLGGLNGALQGNYGLLVKPDDGELLALPQLVSGSTSIQRTAKMRLTTTGTLLGSVQETLLGDEAASRRALLRATNRDADQIKPIEALMAQSMGAFHLSDLILNNVNATDRPVEYRYSLEADSYAKVSGGLLIVRPRLFGSKSSALLETELPRENAIEFEGPRLDQDMFEITLPADYAVDELPPPTDLDLGFASYHSKTEVVGNMLRYTRTFEIKQLSVPVSRAADLKNFYRVIYADERKQAVFSKRQ